MEECTISIVRQYHLEQQLKYRRFNQNIKIYVQNNENIQNMIQFPNALNSFLYKLNKAKNDPNNAILLQAF